MPKRYHHVIRPLPKSVEKKIISAYEDPPGPKMAITQSNPIDAAERMALEGAPDGNEVAVGIYKKVKKNLGGSIKQSRSRSMVRSGCGYQKHQLHLSMAQKRKLVAGHKVRIKHGHLGFADSSLQHVPVHLTMTQLRRLQRAHGSNRGADLQFVSSAQRTMHGKGFFGDLWKNIKNVGRRAYEVVKPVVTEHILPAVRSHVIPRATNYATNLFENRIAPALEARADQAASRLANHIESGVNRGLNAIDQGVSSVGLGLGRRGRIAKRGRRGRGMKGEGFFDDIWSSVKSVASHAVPIATNLVVNRALGPLKGIVGGRGGRQRRMTRGGAPFATGHR